MATHYRRHRTPEAAAVYRRIRGETWIASLMGCEDPVYRRLGTVLLLLEIDLALVPGLESRMRAEREGADSGRRGRPSKAARKLRLERLRAAELASEAPPGPSRNGDALRETRARIAAMRG